MTNLAGRVPLPEIVERVNALRTTFELPLRSHRAVERKMTKLGLQTGLSGGWTLNALRAFFSCGEPLIRQWLEQGILPGRRAGLATGTGADWYVSDQDLRAFLLANPLLYHPSRITNRAWRATVQQAAGISPWLTVTEAGQLVGLSRRTILRYASEGRIPSHPRPALSVGAEKLAFYRSELMDWLRGQNTRRRAS
jgi:excisionase family DNA binding protein